MTVSEFEAWWGGLADQQKLAAIAGALEEPLVVVLRNPSPLRDWNAAFDVVRKMRYHGYANFEVVRALERVRVGFYKSETWWEMRGENLFDTICKAAVWAVMSSDPPDRGWPNATPGREAVAKEAATNPPRLAEQGWDACRGHGLPCHFCKRPMSAFAGDPSEWPTSVPTNSRPPAAYACFGCVGQRLYRPRLEDVSEGQDVSLKHPVDETKVF